MTGRVRVLERIDEVAAADWNGLGVAEFPHLRHEFLSALERHDCVGERFGWLPRHLVIEGPEGELLAACPLYLKFNAYGEFVFDHAWADAWERRGGHYYPKLVSASPYTPATGPKLMIAPDAPSAGTLRRMLAEAALELAAHEGASSVHWLFTTPAETDWFEAHMALPRRIGCQFHWRNRGWTDFDDFLGALSHARRKNIRRERRRVREAGIEFRLLDGHSADEADWREFHLLYRDTFDRKGGVPTLSADFFVTLAEHLPGQVLLVQARRAGRTIAAAFFLVGERTLYGRHWGCRERHDGLHFETCYHQGIEHCLSRGLERFEPGAQGEHKIARGFLPVETRSVHWLSDPAFLDAVRRFLEQETPLVRSYIEAMRGHGPYRQESK